jgi:hypothetical protein
MAGPWINNDVQRLEVRLGRLPGAGPKLDLSVFLVAPGLLAIWTALRVIFPIPLLKSGVSETIILCSILGVLSFVFQLGTGTDTSLPGFPFQVKRRQTAAIDTTAAFGEEG